MTPTGEIFQDTQDIKLVGAVKSAQRGDMIASLVVGSVGEKGASFLNHEQHPNIDTGLSKYLPTGRGSRPSRSINWWR